MIKTALAPASVRTGLAAVLLVALLLAGCTFSASSAELAFSSNVPRDHEASEQASCDDQAELTINMAGLRGGSMRVRVFGGDGATVFEETYLGGEGGDDLRSLFGVAGDWEVEMTGNLAEGDVSVRLAC